MQGGVTALHLAASREHVHCIMLLLEAESDWTVTDKVCWYVPSAKMRAHDGGKTFYEGNSDKHMCVQLFFQSRTAGLPCTLLQIVEASNVPCISWLASRQGTWKLVWSRVTRYVMYLMILSLIVGL